MRKSNLKSNRPSELAQAEDQQSVAEYSNQNMLFRVYSPRKNEQFQQSSTFPTKFTMNIRRQPEIQRQIPYQRQSQQNLHNIGNNANQILQLRRRNDELESKLQKYKGKVNDLKTRVKQQESYINFLQQCRQGLITQSQDNIRKYQQYVSNLDLEFQEKNQTHAEHLERLMEQLKTKQAELVQLSNLYNNSQQLVKVLNSRLSSKEKQFQKISQQHQREIEEIQQYHDQQSKEKIIQLQNDLQKEKLRNQQLIKDYEKVLSEKENIILKMSKFNNEITQKMLNQKNQLLEYTHQEIALLMKHIKKGQNLSNLLKFQIDLKQSNSRLEKQCSLLKDELRKMQAQYQKGKVIEAQQQQRINDLEGLIYQKDKKIDEYCYYIENSEKGSQQAQLLASELAQLSQQLSSVHRMVQQKDEEVIRLQRQLKNTRLQLKLKSQVNELNVQKVKNQLTSQEQANHILRQRIRSVECLKRETPNTYIEQFNPNQYSFKNPNANFQGRQLRNNQMVTSQVKEIGKAFTQLSADLERLINQKLAKQKLQFGNSSKFHSRKGSEQEIDQQNASISFNQRKTQGFNNMNNQEILKLRQVLANQKQNYSKIEKRLLSTIERYHQGNETRSRVRESLSPAPHSYEVIVGQNQSFRSQNHQKPTSPPANSVYYKNFQYQQRKKSSHHNLNKNSANMASFIENNTVNNSKFMQNQGKYVSQYNFNRVIEDSDTQRTVQNRIYRPNDKYRTDRRF